MRNSFLFTSESVSEGHPDKVADQISDSIVDLFLSKDPEARVACETLTTTQLVVLAGEIRCKGVFENGEWAAGALEEIEATVRNTVREIGYEQDGFHWESFRFENNLHAQSAHIAQGVDADLDFHLAIAAASHNRFFVDTLVSMRSHMTVGMELTRKLSLTRPRDALQLMYAEHQVIYDAIAASDVNEASAAMRRHLESARKRVFED